MFWTSRALQHVCVCVETFALPHVVQWKCFPIKLYSEIPCLVGCTEFWIPLFVDSTMISKFNVTSFLGLRRIVTSETLAWIWKLLCDSPHNVRNKYKFLLFSVEENFCITLTSWRILYNHVLSHAKSEELFENSFYWLLKIRGSAVDIVTDYGLDDRGVGVRVPVGWRIFSSPRRPDRLWGPHRLLSNGWQELFPWG
jgi:hypothetical protein